MYYVKGDVLFSHQSPEIVYLSNMKNEQWMIVVI